jgi:uncharacterized membrane protein YjgN (DUF898 family)
LCKQGPGPSVNRLLMKIAVLTFPTRHLTLSSVIETTTIQKKGGNMGDTGILQEAPALQREAGSDHIKPMAFSFVGSGSEYFRIWIVNLLLSIVTLGIYSAWAKVRRTRYFYDNTRLAGTSFDYHGNPVAILKGRIIAVLFIAAYHIAFKTSTAAGLIMLAALLLLGPWLVWKSYQFKLYNTSYRGLRFGFRGSLRGVYINYLLLPALAFLTAYLLAPFTHQKIKKYQHEESRYGNAHFSFHGSVGSFYKVYLIVFGIGIAGALVIGIGFGFGGALSGFFNPEGLKHASGKGIAAFALFVFLLYAWMLSLFPIFLALIQNLIWNNTIIGTHRFESHMNAGRMVFIALTNLTGIVGTVGLFIPFAHVRALKYRIESMSLIGDDSLDEFVAGAQPDASATGEGMADLLDFDLSL